MIGPRQIGSIMRLKIQGLIKTLYRYTHTMVRQFVVDACFTRASALAYTTLLTIVPLMALSLSVLTIFPIFDDVTKKIQDFVFLNFVAGSADIIQQHLLSFAAAARQLSITGLIFLVLTAVMMVFNMETDFNAIWQVQRRRHGAAAFFIYLAVLIFFPIFVGLGMLISLDLGSLPWIKKTSEAIGLRPLLLHYLPYLLTWSAFALLYKTVPNCTVKIRHALVGSFVAMLLFESAKYGFTWYLANFPSYELLYGALAAIPIFLMWLYLTWLIILFGAIVAHTIAVGIETEIKQ